MIPPRHLALALLAATGCAAPGQGALRDVDEGARGRVDVDSARELDQQGVRAFRDGRYADAIRYFRAAYRAGGPASEIWNIARCRERLDDAEGASRTLDQYLAQSGLSSEDRAEAAREAYALRARPSLLTVTTTPAGAFATVDGKQTFGPTPATTTVAPGPHTLAVRRQGYATETRPFDARFGMGVVVSLELSREGR